MTAHVRGDSAGSLMSLVGLLHVDELLLEAAVLLQELLELRGVVLEVTGIGSSMLTTDASGSALDPAPPGTYLRHLILFASNSVIKSCRKFM